MRYSVIPGAACLALLLLAGCGMFDRGAAPACPAVAILADTAELTQFRAGPGRDLTDVEFEAEIDGYSGTCSYSDDNTVSNVVVTIRIIARRGPAATENAVSVPFFVAVADRQQRILAKEVFDSRIEFPAGRSRAGVAEEIEQRIPLGDRQPTDLEVLIGFQLTEAQLEYNRRKRGF